MELEAAIALIMAHSEVLACFDVDEDMGYYLWGIFDFDVVRTLKEDAESYQWVSDVTQSKRHQLIYAPPSALAFLIGAADTLDGNDGVASAYALTFGFIGLVCSYAAWRDWKEFSDKAWALEQKWGNRAPTIIAAHS